MGPVKVRFYATLRQVVGSKSIDLPLRAGATVRELLEAVIARYPEMRASLFDAAGHLYGHVHVFINGRDAPYLERALDTELVETDSVDVFPAIGGG
jgi:molybdopterin synthase sulfur carrier subunit